MDATSQAIEAVLSRLNPQQRAAATAGRDPLLIVAGAGTGKTTTLAQRVAWLIATGADPGRILLLTFTRRAAAGMLRRVDGILRELQAFEAEANGARGRLSSRNVVGGTFHSVAARLLRRHGRLLGLEPEFTILDRSDCEDLINVLRSDLGYAKSDTRFPLKKTCLDIYSRCVNTQDRLETVLETSFPWCVEHVEPLKQLFQSYVDRKEQGAVLDYDDLLLFWNALLADGQAGPLIRSEFDFVLVDEYQDTNVLQAELLKNLRPDGQGLTVVGDDAQSIYSFRAATVRNILDFPEQFPGTRVVPLEQNYRSTQRILDATNRVIALAAERHEKNLWSQRGAGNPPVLVDCIEEDEQTDFIIDQVLEQRECGIPLRNQAVLFRASHHSLALEVELARRNVPFHKYGGLKFIETAHVKDLIAFLRLAENPRDSVAGMRILLLLPGVGPKRASQLVRMLAESKFDFSCWDDFKPPAAAAEIWAGLLTLLKRLTKRSSNVAGDVHQVRIFYAPLLEQTYDYAKPRLRDLEQLEQVAGRFADRSSFLVELALDPPTSTQDMPGPPVLDEDYLVLSTIHSAKGLEWDSVFVIHAADGNIPSDMSTGSAEEIEEERRLFYVALTRARNNLFVCVPQRYYFHGRYRSDAYSFVQVTRFLPPEILTLFERKQALPTAETRPMSTPTATTTTAEIRGRLKGMWS